MLIGPGGENTEKRIERSMYLMRDPFGAITPKNWWLMTIGLFILYFDHKNTNGISNQFILQYTIVPKVEHVLMADINLNSTEQTEMDAS